MVVKSWDPDAEYSIALALGADVVYSIEGQMNNIRGAFKNFAEKFCNIKTEGLFSINKYVNI